MFWLIIINKLIFASGGVEAAAMLKVGSKFYTFDELSSRLEEFQDLEQVQLWVRDSRTVVAAAKRARRKSLNPALKYAELTYSCVFGGRRPSDQTKIHNQYVLHSNLL